MYDEIRNATMNGELDYWKGILNARAKELGLSETVRPVQPANGEMIAVHWVIEMEGQLVNLGWNVEDAQRELQMLAMQAKMDGM